MKNCFNVILIFFISTSLFSQQSNQTDSVVSKKKRFERKSIDGNTEVYLDLAWSNTFRKIEESASLLAKPLGEKVNEKPLKIWSYGIGFRTYLHQNVALGIGLNYLRNGETFLYNSTDSDSSYSYTNEYSYISLPIRLQYVKGEKIKIMGGISLFPQLINNLTKSEKWITTENEEITKKSKTAENLNSLVFSAGFNAGLQYKFTKLSSVFIMPEYRLQLNNTFSNQYSYRHFANAFTINFGLIYQL